MPMVHESGHKYPSYNEIMDFMIAKGDVHFKELKSGKDWSVVRDFFAQQNPTEESRQLFYKYSSGDRSIELYDSILSLQKGE